MIDSDNYAAAGIQTMFFPGGEPHVKLPAISGDVLLHLKLRSWADTTFAALVLDAVCRSDTSDVHAFVPYFPGARQDRADGRSALTLGLVGDMLTRNRAMVAVFDPHSHAIFEHAAVWRSLMPEDLDVPVRNDVVGVIAPDAGARQRASSFRDRFYPGREVLECSKRRDPAMGLLSSYHMPPLPAKGRYIIVDDICDGGGTFNLLANAFSRDPLAAGSQLELFVSHGIFSRGLAAISPVISRITTTDSWCQLASDDRLDVIPLRDLFSLVTGVARA